MSIYPNETEHDLISLSKLAEQQKKQRPIKNKYESFKQTHDKELAEAFSSTTNLLDEGDKSTNKNWSIFFKKSEDENTQTPALRNIIGTPSLRDFLTLLIRSKKKLY